MQRSWSRASAVSVAGTVVAMLGLLLTAVPVAGGSSATCDYNASAKRVRVTITGSGAMNVYENGSGQIWVGSTWCDNVATVTNTDRITILAGAGDQYVSIHWNGPGFQPGATNEAGDSDEIEFGISLGTGTDKLSIGLDPISEKVRLGKSSGFAVAGRMNLNAGETTGIDADITLVVGIELVRINASAGHDVVSGAGGAGTGDAFTIPLELLGHIGDDTLTGGTAIDDILGAEGNDTLIGGASGDKLNGGADADTLKGGPGPDFLRTADGVSGNDQAYGGTGADTCLIDRGDATTSC